VLLVKFATFDLLSVVNPLASHGKRLRQARNAVHLNLTTELWCRRSCANAPNRHRHTMCVRPNFSSFDSPFPGELTIEEAHYLLLPRGRQRPRPEVLLLREWLLAQARS
jgi:hypothetical protein